MKNRETIDWEAARSRLEQVGRRVDVGTASAAQQELIFRRRAEALARPAIPPGSSEEGDAVMILRLGDERYGVLMSSVSEVITDAPLAPVPGAPPHVAGVIQVRGEIRPVFHFARLLDLPDSPESDTVVLLSQGGREIGLLSGRVDDIRAVAAADRHPAESRYADWMTADLVMVLNLDSLLGREN